MADVGPCVRSSCPANKKLERPKIVVSWRAIGSIKSHFCTSQFAESVLSLIPNLFAILSMFEKMKGYICIICRLY